MAAAAESCENTFVMATSGSKSLKPKNNNTHKGERKRKRTEQRKRGRGRERGSQCKENPITKMNLCTFQREQTNNTAR